MLAFFGVRCATLDVEVRCIGTCEYKQEDGHVQRQVEAKFVKLNVKMNRWLGEFSLAGTALNFTMCLPDLQFTPSLDSNGLLVAYFPPA